MIELLKQAREASCRLTQQEFAARVDFRIGRARWNCAAVHSRTVPHRFQRGAWL